jgi:hypothetical protein
MIHGFMLVWRSFPASCLFEFCGRAHRRRLDHGDDLGMVPGVPDRSQQPIVQFDYKTEADCDASRIAVKAQYADAASQSWCVPIPKPEKAAKAKPKKRKPLRSAKRR